MKDKSQNDLEKLFEKHIVLKERFGGDPIASRLASKPIQQVIDTMVRLIDLGQTPSPELIARVVDEEKIGSLISTLERQHIPVPQEVAHALTMGDSGMTDDIDSDEVEISRQPEVEGELDFSKRRFSEIPDEESEEQERSISLDPAMR